LTHVTPQALTRWENHRTQSDVDNAIIAKNFVFQFLNNYGKRNLSLDKRFLGFPYETPFCMGRLYGRTGRLTGQKAASGLSCRRLCGPLIY
jgi:hypothetical protein